MEIIVEFISTVYVVDNGKVLLTWNKKVNNWIPIGGHIEANELPCDSVIREAREESGLEIELICSHGLSESSNLIQPVHLHLDHVKEDHKHINMTYFGTIKGGKCSEKDDEGKDLRWFTKNELKKEDLLPNVKEWALQAIKTLGAK